MSRTWKMILAASVVLNLFLLGAGVGVLVAGSRALGDRAEVHRDRDGQRMSAAFEALPPERRSAMRELMRTRALAAAPDMREAFQARRRASELMAAPQYDPKAVEAALDRARQAENRARARIDATLAARLAELTPEERAAFSRVLMFGPRGGGRGPRGPGMDHRGPPDAGPPGAPPPT